MSVKRGDIIYVDSIYSTGSEQRGGRPAVIVSNQKNNDHSNTVEVVYLTTQPKADLPTHVTIRSTGRESTALCEQISTVAVERLRERCGHVTDVEMSNMEIAMLISQDLYTGTVKEKIVEVVKEVEVPAEPKKNAPGGGRHLRSRYAPHGAGHGKGKGPDAPHNVRFAPGSYVGGKILMAVE